MEIGQRRHATYIGVAYDAQRFSGPRPLASFQGYVLNSQN